MPKNLFHSAGLNLAPSQIQTLERLADLVLEKNKTVNLTSIRDRDEFLVKQVLNSLMLNRFIEFRAGWQVADLGTGGGFPGLPLAITHPDCQFTLIDSVHKKIDAVESFVQALGLNHVEGIAERLEVVGQHPEYRERFNLVTAQALAPLPVLLELAIPLVKVGGIFAAFKGPNYGQELTLSSNALKQLRLENPDIKSYSLPDEMGQRFLLIFLKTKPTPSVYPRAVGIPNKKPL